MAKLIPRFDLERYSIVFGRLDGSIIFEGLTLQGDGQISPALPNEHSWEFHDGGIVFKDAQGTVTTIFDHHVTRDGHVEIHGKFLPISTDAYHHVLRLYLVSELNILPSGQAHYVPRLETKVAVLIRSHVVNSKFYDLYEKLKGSNCQFDVFPLIDNSNGPVKIDAENVIFHSAHDARNLYLKSSRQNLFWWCGDYPLYFAYRAQPDYDYYIMIEYDLQFLEDPIVYINKICAKLSNMREIDLIALDLRRHDADEWDFQKLCRHYFRESWAIFFPFLCVSRRSLSYLLAIRQQEYLLKTPDINILHCEPFVAGNLILSGFKCIDLNDFIDRSYTVPSMKIPNGIFLGADTSQYIDCSMIHPVYDLEQFINALNNKFKAGGIDATIYNDSVKEISEFLSQKSNSDQKQFDTIILEY